MSAHDPSGLALAEEAHAAGAVEPVDALPNFTVVVEFVVHGTREHAESIAGTLAYELAVRSDVAGNVTCSIDPRDGLGEHRSPNVDPLTQRLRDGDPS
ncbi:MAG TPA: hypothetical protein VIV40_08605 [Kofleriaceae bacterium]